ncbi:MAG: alanine--tRNA ligase [Defluviitaleaceae bacterium]|nr:alanine--tRNA ligase [Defluviitaleaceae bacterium]MCL2239898.1 alanine--tRNA ligase [Defluviitaleaceae bacterium]
MKYLTVDQIREKFLDFFVARSHLVLPSFPVVPQGDKSLLLIGAGMAPMKPFFTGQQAPPGQRVVTCQKCIRTVDIDDVGKDDRHGSFFEMLGNFSFGDYFKEEAIAWAWRFVLDEMALPPERLYVSVYEEDDEAYALWRDKIGLPAGRIFRLGKEDNFWEVGVGPCGPCSEIHFDRGEAAGCGKPGCAVGCDCDRFMEIWNLVFIQSYKDEEGVYSPLERVGIDTGMGLDRMAMVMQEVASIFEIDAAKTIRDKVRALAGLTGTESSAQKTAVNIITDHVRAVVVMASDGVRPGSEGRDYVLRRLLRRAVRYGREIGLTGFVSEVAQAVIAIYGNAYPNIAQKATHIVQMLGAEEARFLETLETGLSLLQKYVEDMKKGGGDMLPGADAFKLYDTYGFPPDITREILADAGLGFDQAGFDAQMQAQKKRARAARGATTYMGSDETVYHQLPPNMPTEFVGYDAMGTTGEVLALVAGTEVAQEAAAGQEVAVVLSRTPFYAASGGQKGDVGTLSSSPEWPPVWEIEISDCVKVAGENTVHLGKVVKGTVKTGDTAFAGYDITHRIHVTRNHTATHLLQKALREIVGEHIEQAGSEVTAERLRFDFTHHGPLTPQERAQVERLVNEQILSGLQIDTLITTPEEARNQGALALFGEKYADTVRMVSVGNYSVELCGGTHVKSTTEIGSFKLLSESGIAAGVRRIEAVTGTRAITAYREAAAALAEIADLVKAPPGELTARVAAVLAENKELKKAASRKQAEAAKGQLEETAAGLLQRAEEHKGMKLIAAKLAGYDIEALRLLSDKIKAGMASGCLLLAATHPDTGAVQFLASATDDAVKAGIHAGNIVKAAAALCGGNGGGRPNHAQAGGKDAARADDALAGGLAQMKGALGA